MKIKQLKAIINRMKDNQDVVFYNLSNYNLQEYRLESILDVDGRCEITTTEEEVND
tara:strand:+ start:99 stop:266 length:168 start_codon:yes stop_codon:yes gene_type:complete